jgi:DNA-directed RNA polymerase subunit M/transcription elongation factor TFIIS
MRVPFGCQKCSNLLHAELSGSEATIIQCEKCGWFNRVALKDVLVEYLDTLANDAPTKPEHEHGWDPTTRTFYPD